jgi:hypothetical protein
MTTASTTKTFRFSLGYVWLGLVLAALGAATAAGMLLTVADIGGKILGAVVGGGFFAFGIALVLKAAVERVVVNAAGIAKYGFPFGVCHFRAVWPEVVSYTGSDTTAADTDRYRNIRQYVLATPIAQLPISAYDPFFPELHSAILSHLQTRATVRIPNSTAGEGRPVTADREFSYGEGPNRSGTTLFAGIAGLALGFAGYFTRSPDIPTKVGSVELSEAQKQLFGGILLGLGAALLLFAIVLFFWNRRSSIRLTASGIEYRRGWRLATFIPWGELRSFEHLYDYCPDRRQYDRPTYTVDLSGGRVSTCALIGSGGQAIYLSSGMSRFPEFKAAITAHAPPATMISLQG